jgi:hypothetical protein
MARAKLARRPWSALRFELALEAQEPRRQLALGSNRIQPNWFVWRIVRTLASSRRLWSLEEISDHLKCAEFEAAAALRALRCLHLVIVATTPAGEQAYALSPAAGSDLHGLKVSSQEPATRRNRKRQDDD